MKKFIVVLFIFVTIQLNAQEKIALGIKLGQNFTSVNNVNVDRNAASYHIGATAQIGIGGLFSIVPEVILSQTKLETNPALWEIIKETKPETFHLNYLSIPIMAQFKPFKTFLIQAGPQYSILLDQKKDGLENARVAFKSGEFALVGGAKIDLGGFFIYGRYVIGMNHINSAKVSFDDFKDQSNWKTRQWQLGVGLNLFKF